MEQLSEITISEAKDMLAKGISKGCACPACGQHVQMYKRTITRAMAKGLSILASLPDTEKDKDGFFHMEKAMKKYCDDASARGDMPKLRFWGLLEAREGKREDGSSRNGYYRVTLQGFEFLRGKIEVEKSLWIFNDKVKMRSEEKINFEKAIQKGNRFKYSDI